MTVARRTAFIFAVLSLVLAAASPAESRPAKDPLRQLRATIHDVFSPPRRTRRAKAKPAAPAAPTAPAAKARPDQAAKLPDGKKTAPQPPEQKTARPEPVAKQSKTKERAPTQPEQKTTRREKVAKPPETKERAAAEPAQRARPEQSTKQTQTKERAPTPPPEARAARPERPGKQPETKERAAPSPEQRSARPERSAALPPAQQPAVTEPKPSTDDEPAPVPGPSACQLRLTPALAAVRLLPSVSVGQCTVDDAVRLEAVMAHDGRRVALNPPATLRCTMAEAVIHWIRDELAPAAGELGSTLRGLAVDTSFECRSRNRVAGAKLSEHGHANAIDLRAFTLANGTIVNLTDIKVEKAVRERIKQAACARFTTVLGPGSDAYHETHIHLDLAERRSGYRMCQWDVRDVATVPMPPERPRSDPPRSAGTGTTGAKN
jgi:hypothetical protein